MTRAIVTAFHHYTPYGKEFYEPIFKFYMKNMMSFQDEFDALYLIDSTWRLKGIFPKTKIIEVNPSLRYYDAYKQILPQITEDLVLFMDNDMLVWKNNLIRSTFEKLYPYYHDGSTQKTPIWDVVSIYDTIGDYSTSLLGGKNKFCPYWFAARKDLLMKYKDVEWGPDMPFCETLGHLTQEMLKGGARPYEWEEDKSSLYFDGSEGYSDGTGKSKQLGYYHIRAGSTIPYLLATKKYGDRKTYDDYLKNQPRNEYLRQLAWYQHMADQEKNRELWGEIWMLLEDIRINHEYWNPYMDKFEKYHGLV